MSSSIECPSCITYDIQDCMKDGVYSARYLGIVTPVLTIVTKPFTDREKPREESYQRKEYQPNLTLEVYSFAQ